MIPRLGESNWGTSRLSPGFSYDQETGVYQYRARYYDSATGRFLSGDPIQFLGGVNFYSYANNDPVLNVDPSGMLVEVVCVPVQQKYLGIIVGARHCAIHVKYDDVDIMLERLGPKTLNKEHWNGRNGLRPRVTRPTGDRCKDFEKKVIERFEYYEKHIGDMPDYDPVNSNSNAFVQQLIRDSGGDVEYPSEFTWRYGYNFFGQMPDK